KLGLPDLVVQDAPLSQSKGVGVIMNAIAQHLVEGAKIDANARLTLDFASVRHPGARKWLVEQTLPGSTRGGTVSCSIAETEQGDAENRLLELRFDDYPGATEVERQAAAVGRILGSEQDRVTGVPAGDPEIAEV